MGTWDIGFFDNDMACDWENEIKNNNNLSYIESTLNPVLKNKEDFLDIDLANKAIAASDSIARLLGSNSEKNSYTTHIDTWAKDFKQEISQELINKAIIVLGKVLESNSELKQFWTLRGDFENWKTQIVALKEFLLGKYENKFK